MIFKILVILILLLILLFVIGPLNIAVFLAFLAQ